MEKKLTINTLKSSIAEKASKFGSKILRILPPAILAAAILSFSSCQTVPQQQSNPYNGTSIESFEYDNQFQNSIASNSLFGLQDSKRNESEVRKELCSLLANMNRKTLDLSNDYEILESTTMAKNNLSVDRINQIASNQGIGATKEEQLTVAQMGMRHFIHLMLKTQTLIRLGADDATFLAANERDTTHNTFVSFSTTTPERSVKNESAEVLTTMEKYIFDYVECGWAFENNTAEVNKKVADIKANIKNLQQLTTLSSNLNYQYITELIEGTAPLLPSSIFGPLEARKSLLKEISEQYLLISLISKLEGLGYGMNNLKASELLNKGKVSFESLNLGAEITNTHSTVKVGADAKVNLPQNFFLNFGGEMSYSIDYEKGSAFSIQATTEPGYTFNNDHSLSVPLNIGAEFDKSGMSVPFGAGINYAFPLSNKTSLGFGMGTSANFMNRSELDLLGSVSYTITAKSGMKIKFTLAAGGAIKLLNPTKTTNSNDNDDQGIIEGDTNDDGGLQPFNTNMIR